MKKHAEFCISLVGLAKSVWCLVLRDFEQQPESIDDNRIKSLPRMLIMPGLLF